MVGYQLIDSIYLFLEPMWTVKRIKALTVTQSQELQMGTAKQNLLDGTYTPTDECRPTWLIDFGGKGQLTVPEGWTST